MRILHVVATYLPAVRYGGPIYSVHGLAAGQAALGHDVSVFTTNVDGPSVSDVPLATPVDLNGVQVTYFPVTMPRRLYRSPAMGRAFAADISSFDIVHLHSVFLWPMLAAARVCARAGVPYVLSPRGMLVADLIRAKSGVIKKAWIALFERRTIAEAAALHFTSEREAADFTALDLGSPRAILLPNGVEEPRLIADPLAPDIVAATAVPGYALYLGRLNWKKNLVPLIRSVADLPTARLVIAGTDDERHSTDLRAAIAEAKLEDRVTLIDRNVEGIDKERLFDACGLFVLPSLNENFGNTVLEAMVRRRAVVVSAGAGVAEVVRDTECGLVCDPDPASLGAAIGRLMDDPSLAETMGARGRNAAIDRFGWKTIAARMIDAYGDILATR